MEIKEVQITENLILVDMKNENYKAIIKDLIHRYNTKLEYVKLDVDLHTLWEQLKQEIRTISISYLKSLSNLLNKPLMNMNGKYRI